MNTYKQRLSAAVIAALFATPSIADEGRWYVAPGLNYIITDSDRKSDDNFGIVLGAGKQLTHRWNLELSFVFDKLDFSNGSGEYDQKGFVVDGLYYFNRGSGFIPYAIIGGGFLQTDSGKGNDTNLALNAGVGMEKQITNNGLGIRGDIRYRIDDDDSSVADQNRFGDWILGVSIKVPFGRSSNKPDTPKTVAVLAEPIDQDNDADGVLDSKDRCLNTPKNAKVDVNGCEVVVPKDDDGDGVADSRDSCPNTAKGVKVDASGCEVTVPKDGDGDGVVDSDDRCPNSIKGAKVSDAGCEVITLEGVTFESNSSTLRPSSVSNLDNAAATLLQRGDIKVEIAGHTDSMGEADYNKTLSAARANTVREYLINNGVNGDNLTAKGYGEEEPVDNNRTAKGRAANRRVELRIQE